MKQLTCPSCTAGVIEASNFDVVCCQQCGLHWTYISKDLDQTALYSEDAYSVIDNRGSLFEKVIRLEARRVLAIAGGIMLNGEKKLLDFGSGKGQFLAEATHVGWSGVGVETALERASFSREKYGLNVIGETFKFGIVGEGGYNLITLNHVFEHLEMPLHLIQKLTESNLNENGVIMIEVPRRDSWQSRLAGHHWLHLDIPRHLSHWTEDGLKKAMGNIGFKVVAKRSFSLHIGVLGMLHAILVRFGYSGSIIYDLKARKKKWLFVVSGILLPIATVIEVIATIFNSGGIIGLYFVKSDSNI